MEDTLYPGSGGGAGAAASDHAGFASGGGGGGTGGGALRLTSETSITVSGQLLANGGDGGSVTNGGGCAGSGGVVWVQAPNLNIDWTISAQGGYAGASCADEASPDEDYRLGDYRGGMGRIRITTNSDSCDLIGQFSPPLADGCNLAETALRAYVSEY